MKTFLFTLILCLVVVAADAQTRKFRVAGHTFLTQTVQETFEDDEAAVFLKLYRLERGKKVYLLKHIVYSKSGDCNNIFEDIGKMKINGSKIIFTTHFLQKLRDPIPEWRRQVYQVSPTGKLRLIYDKYKMNGRWTTDPYNR